MTSSATLTRRRGSAPGPARTRRRVILYARVSKDDRDGLSPTGQLSGLRRWAEQNGREIVAELRDDGISASRFAAGKPRPDWEVARAIIESGGADELAVRKISRATRDPENYAKLKAACILHRVNIVVDGRSLDPRKANDGFTLGMEVLLAERDSVEISENTMSGKREAAAAGRPAANLNFGYQSCVTKSGRGKQRKAVGRRDPLVLDLETGERRRERVPDDQEPYLREIDPDTAPVFRDIVRRLLKEESASSIVKDLNTRGVSPMRGGRWTPSNLGRMVVNEVYLGQRVYTDEHVQEHTVPGLWPPLVTPEEHRRLVALYDSADRDKFRHTSITRHLGTGIYRCGREGCEGRMRVIIGRTDGGRADRYDCRDCHRVARTQEPVDRLVTKLIIAYLSAPTIAAELAEMTADEEAKRAADDVERITGELAKARRMVTARKITLDDFAAMREPWERELREAEERARPKHLPAAVFDTAGPQAAAKWKALGIEGKRSILAALFTVVIRPAARPGAPFDPDSVEITWQKPSISA